ncbi:MAG: class I SAM-dependent methyltransferase [Burkholderiales bacterium]|nr:class I SAM-dependent methyltransferase [Burkholderiales bacterium]
MAERNWYERRVLPLLTDIACGMPPIRRQRERIVPLARGRVLEVGIGTGRNLAHYVREKIDALVGLDPAPEMLSRARRRARRAGIEAHVVVQSAERIPCADASFDTVLVTYALCSIADPLAALAEMRRVLKPDGRLLFLEHGLAPDPAVRRWQSKLSPFWSRIAGGCRLDRDVPALLRSAGFRCEDLQAAYLPGPRVLAYNYWGAATAG